MDDYFNSLVICGRRHHGRQPVHFDHPRVIPGHPGRTSSFPNCTFTVTFPQTCEAIWQLGRLHAVASNNSPRCPNGASNFVQLLLSAGIVQSLLLLLSTALGRSDLLRVTLVCRLLG